MTKPLTLTRRQLRVVLAALRLAAERENSAADSHTPIVGRQSAYDRRAANQHKRSERVFVAMHNELSRKLTKED